MPKITIMPRIHTLTKGNLAACPLKIFLPMDGLLIMISLLNAIRERRRLLIIMAAHLITADAKQMVFPRGHPLKTKCKAKSGTTMRQKRRSQKAR